MPHKATCTQGTDVRGRQGNGARGQRAQGRKFLPEVQALRAIAVLAVVA
ncbi:hypothetical protein [Pseudoglutamicibacter cumminsii]|nr:hypothetical protein [Pseudoglutamicibacter cumminsii]